MTGIHYVAVTLTFITGMFVGAFLYTTSFAPDQAQRQVERATNEWEIIATASGGCQMVGNNCPRWQLVSDRNYRYATNSSAEPATGKITVRTKRALETALEDANYTAFETSPTACRAAYDGIDYEYDITLAGQRVVVSTCATAFADSSLATVLNAVWRELENGPQEPVIIEEGLQGFLKRTLDEQFDYDE